MNKIEELQAKIDEMEGEAAKLNHADTSGDYYKDLYSLLSVAYFALKDIEALRQGNIPMKDDQASKATLMDAQDALALATTTISERDDEIFKLKAFADGMNLEAEIIVEKNKALQATMDTITKLLVTV